MTLISSHPNVYNTCLRLLRGLGYELEAHGELDEEGIIIPESMWWSAHKGEVSLRADNPIELLGLAHVHGAASRPPHEPYWWVRHGEDIRDELLERCFPDEEEEE